MTKILIILSLFIFSGKAQAYQSLLTSGDMIQPQTYQFLPYLESIFDEYDGLNINSRLAYGFNEELQGDVEIGFGEFDVMLGAFLKWVPIPDYEKQPAIGVRAGLSYIDTNRYSQTSVTAMPFVSKGIETPHGRIVPYLGLPMAINSNSDDTYFSTRLAFGTEWTHPTHKRCHAVAELGLELSKSFSSLTVGASYDF
ncbi:hypothetical protein K2X05_07825 [bacterium]|nr:hypothetical protein [bacterium]